MKRWTLIEALTLIALVAFGATALWVIPSPSRRAHTEAQSLAPPDPMADIYRVAHIPEDRLPTEGCDVFRAKTGEVFVVCSREGAEDAIALEQGP